MKAKPTPKKPRRASGSVKTLAEAIGISQRHTRNLLDAGMPPDPQAAARWRQEKAGAGISSSAERLREERILFVQESRRKIQTETDIATRKLVDARQVTSSLIAVLSAFRARLMAIPHTLPPALVGLDEIRMSAILRDEIYQVLDELSSLKTMDFLDQ